MLSFDSASNAALVTALESYLTIFRITHATCEASVVQQTVLPLVRQRHQRRNQLPRLQLRLSPHHPQRRSRHRYLLRPPVLRHHNRLFFPQNFQPKPQILRETLYLRNSLPLPGLLVHLALTCGRMERPRTKLYTGCMMMRSKIKDGVTGSFGSDIY